MRFTFFKKLREPESGAGGAPAPSAPASTPTSAPAAASAATPPPVAVPGEAGVPSGQGQAPSPAPGATAPDWTVDPEGYATWFDNASDEERAKHFEGNPQPVEEIDLETGEPKEPANEPASDSLPVELDAEGLTEEEFAQLPPRAQEALRQAQELGQMVESNKDVLDPTFQADLKVAFSDPVIAQRLAELQHGLGVPKWLEGDFDSSAMVDAFLKDVQEQDIDLSLNPEKTKENLANLVNSAVTDALKRVEVRQQFERAEHARIVEETKVLANGFANLTQEFASLRSDKPIDSAEHPVEAFRTQLLEHISNGEISFKYATENMKSLFAGFATKNSGVKELVEKGKAQVRTQFIRKLTDTARQGAISAVGAKPQGAAQQANAFGIDEARYASDATYRSSLLVRAEETAEKGDNRLFGFLDKLDRKIQ
jgi:hypothetical protein